ncbi:MAG: ribonuclease III [Patescibacteria group bacterium]
MPPAPFTILEKTIGVHFRNKDLLVQSLTHRSATRASKGKGNNERLEFLGDAVLELAVTEYLYEQSSRPEGELTNWRSALVQGENLAAVAKELKLGEYLVMSRGEDASGGREKASTLANAVEALIGALYLDQGWHRTQAFINEFILIRLRDILAQGKERDAKSVFQEEAQERTGVTPTYTVLEEVGPDHDKVFTVAAYIGSEEIAEGKGNSKQRAEQDAAEKALKKKRWGKK